MSLEEFLVHGHVFDADYRFIGHKVHDLIHKEEGVAMRDDAHDGIDIEDHFRGLLFLIHLLQLLFPLDLSELLYQFHVCFVSAACCQDMSFDGYAQECDVSQEVYHFMAHKLVVIA